jgi:hypothetical protein
LENLSVITNLRQLEIGYFDENDFFKCSGFIFLIFIFYFTLVLHAFVLVFLNLCHTSDPHFIRENENFVAKLLNHDQLNQVNFTDEEFAR